MSEAALEVGRAGKGPILLELKTDRYRGHSMSDPAKYRSREEVQAVRDKSDAIEHLKKLMLDAGIAEDKFKEIDKEIRAVVSEAADFAESAPEPDLPRSEEHTSELQSLMRISYAVFCLKKKKINQPQNTQSRLTR